MFQASKPIFLTNHARFQEMPINFSIMDTDEKIVCSSTLYFLQHPRGRERKKCV